MAFAKSNDRQARRTARTQSGPIEHAINEFTNTFTFFESVAHNLSSHKGPEVCQAIAAAGARLLYLPPDSPDFNPIENAFAKLKALLRKAAEPPVDSLWDAIGHIIDLFTPSECANYFAAAGYEPD